MTPHVDRCRPGLAVLGLLPALAAAACGSVEEPAPDAVSVTWRADVATLLARQCAPCHRGPRAAGGYEVDRYEHAIAPLPDGRPAAAAGDAASPLLVVLTDETHQAALAAGDTTRAAERHRLLRRWVVEDRLAYFDSPFHGPDIMDPSSDGSHGRTIAGDGWSLARCRRCHGGDYAGGLFGVPCTGCHTEAEGPEACDTCHGAGPQGGPPPGLGPLSTAGAGAHAAHLKRSAAFDPVDCSACHLVPETLDAAGHLDDPLPVAVTFSGRALARGSEPVWDPASRTCSDVACHGAGLADGGAAALRWDDDAQPDDCTGCHGAPPTSIDSGESHPDSTACEFCHPEVAGTDQTIAHTARHGDGEVLARAGAEACGGCHFVPDEQPPFYVTDGLSDPGSRPVGAHERHRESGFFAPGFECEVCHEVPDTIGAEGHLDSSPAEVRFGGPATGAGARPVWDPETGTCTGTWCHGPGAPEARPRQWAQGEDETLCGDCHGLPPSNDDHIGTVGCDDCHPEVIDGHLVFIAPALHPDGATQVVE